MILLQKNKKICSAIKIYGIYLLIIIVISFGDVNSLTNGYDRTLQQSESIMDASEFLRDFDRQASEMCIRVATNEWKYATNTSDYNRRRMKEQQSVAAKFECLSWKRAATFNIDRINDKNIQRQLNRIYRQGKCGLGDEKYHEFTQLIGQMKEKYNSIKICPYIESEHNNNKLNVVPIHPGVDPKIGYYDIPNSVYNYCELKYDPDLIKIMQKSRNENELKYVWDEFHGKTGPPLRNSFMRYLDMANQGAQRHGFRDAGEQMRSIYEDKDFFFEVQDLWTRVLPLYKQLFTFVRKGLTRQYGYNVIRPDGPIPAHLLGNMWGQNWKNLLPIIKQEQTETPDVTDEMVRQGFTPLKIFQTAEEFFTSMGLPAMSPEFWRNSMIQKTNEQHNAECTASAWDFCNNADFRVKQCTQITKDDFINSHHEMAHIQYYMQYSSQPFVYREGPNPAYHEAVAHAIGLCVGGPVHLQHMGLLQTPIQTSNGNSIINIEYLLSLSLEKLPFMAFSLALEKWRWYIFEKGPIGLNSKWWDLRLRYQGLIPPVQRSAEYHFDAGAKYHVISDQDYIKYFIATILQFQIFKELCQAAGHNGPLHTCDFYRSREAGRLLSEMMQYGGSLSSSDLLKVLTRGHTNRLSADALVEYFRPLETWLDQQNRNEPVIGWNSNLDDVAMYQPLNHGHQIHSNLWNIKFVIGFLLWFYVLLFKNR